MSYSVIQTVQNNKDHQILSIMFIGWRFAASVLIDTANLSNLKNLNNVP